ncbi:MAG: hypothetical protein AB1465_07280, partial [Patescibacteria group bacterium]
MFQKLKKILTIPEIWIFIIYIVLSIIFYPSILHLNIFISGNGGGDDFGGIYNIWWIKYANLNNLDTHINSLLNYPFGISFSQTIHPLWDSINNLQSHFFSEIFIYNIMNWISFPLSAIAMFFLTFYVTKNKLASFISGLVYAFSPYHFIRATGHTALVHIEWIPLYVLFLLKVFENKKIKNAFLAGIFLSLTFLADPYYAIFAIIFTATFFSVKLFVLRGYFLKEIKLWLILGLTSLFIVSLFLLPTYFLQLKKIENFAGARPIGDLYAWGAKFKQYFLPNIDNYLFGEFFRKIFWFDNLYPGAEQYIYLGWPGILLAGYGVWRWSRLARWRRTRLKSGVRDIDDNDSRHSSGILRRFAPQDDKSFFDFVMILFIVTAIACTIFSFAPPLSLSKWIYKILPQFRVYARFFVFVSLSVSVLAGVGMKYLFEWVEKFSTRLTRSNNNSKGILRLPLASLGVAQDDAGFLKRLKYYIFIFIFIAVLVDFAPSFKTTDVSKVPEEYVWLKNLSDEVRDSSISHSREIPRFARNDAVVQEDSSISHSREIPRFARNDAVVQEDSSISHSREIPRFARNDAVV